jgi:hypothetical protein
MSYQDAVTVVPEVLVVRRLDFGWQCEIAGEPVFVSTLQIAPDFLMPLAGKRGPIKLRGAALQAIARLVPRAFRTLP